MAELTSFLGGGVAAIGISPFQPLLAPALCPRPQDMRAGVWG